MGFGFCVFLKENIKLSGWEMGKGLGGADGDENIIKMYCITINFN